MQDPTSIVAAVAAGITAMSGGALLAGSALLAGGATTLLAPVVLPVIGFGAGGPIASKKTCNITSPHNH